ncbi:MAG: 16S rRNA methyltransferase, partial [Acidilobus sp.]
VIILLESALELVPGEITHHSQVMETAKRYGLRPGEMLLDAGIHGRAMRSLKGFWRRGRPDIVHLSLLNLLEKAPIRGGVAEVYMHLQDGRVFAFSPQVRIPKNYDRFKGLMAQLLRLNRVPPEGEPLIWRVASSLREFLGGRRLILLSEDASDELTPLGVVRESQGTGMPIGFGAYPSGPLSDEVKSLAARRVRIRRGEPLKAWDVACALSCSLYDLMGDREGPRSGNPSSSQGFSY